MPADWPAADEGIFRQIEDDLFPLATAYTADPDEVIPEEELRELHRSRLRLAHEDFAEPLTNGTAEAVAWEYVIEDALLRLRGAPVPKSSDIVIRGVTIVHTGPGGEPMFRRYVDWAGVWAQLGVSAGRGEDGGEQRFLKPDGEELPAEEVLP